MSKFVPSDPRPLWPTDPQRANAQAPRISRRWVSGMRSRVATASMRTFSALVRIIAVFTRTRAGTRPADGMTEVRNILVIRIDELGDAVLFTPFVRELRRSNPEAHISLVVNEHCRGLFQACPYIDELVGFPVTRQMRLRYVTGLLTSLRLARQFRRSREFDLALVPRWDVDIWGASTLALLSGARHRMAYSTNVSPRKASANAGFDSFFTRTIDDRSHQHEVDRSLRFLAEAGSSSESTALEVWWTQADTTRARSLRGDAGPYVVLCVSAGHSQLKMWPLERFAELARLMASNAGTKVILVGGRGERAASAVVAEAVGPQAINLAGDTSIGELAALLSEAQLFIGNDTGVMHLSAAVRTPTMGIFGPSDPERFGPWAERATIVWLDPPCGPIHRPGRPDRCPQCIYPAPICLTSITVDLVHSAAVERRTAQDNSS